MKVFKNILILLVLVAIAAAAYFVFFAKDESGAPLLQRTSTLFGGGAVLGERSAFLSTLLNIKNLRLETSIFDSEAFQNLKDFTVPITSFGDEGRPNPFAPLGFDSSVPASAPASGIEQTFILEELEQD